MMMLLLKKTKNERRWNHIQRSMLMIQITCTNLVVNQLGWWKVIALWVLLCCAKNAKWPRNTQQKRKKPNGHACDGFHGRTWVWIIFRGSWGMWSVCRRRAGTICTSVRRNRWRWGCWRGNGVNVWRWCRAPRLDSMICPLSWWSCGCGRRGLLGFVVIVTWSCPTHKCIVNTCKIWILGALLYSQKHVEIQKLVNEVCFSICWKFF